jgi:hypothetical protein
MFKKLCVVLFVMLLGPAHPAVAFNATGHKIVAEVAWQKLNAAQRQAIVDILRKHPRFTKDFKNEMPQAIAQQGADAQNHWIFCQAAIWPDIVRGIQQPDKGIYHRPRWHYINLPVFLDDDQADAFAGNLVANVSFAIPSGGDEEKLNGVQAVKNSFNIVSSSQSTAKEKAVHYCWLIHVIPDLAQPLHSAALFTTGLFPAGDKGGNAVSIRRDTSSGNGGSLHSVWDGLLGSGGDFDSVVEDAKTIIQAHPAEFNAPFAALPDDVWATESQAVAVQAAYGALLPAIREAEEEQEDLDVIDVPESYFDAGKALSQKRAVTAGVRLAGVLAATIPSAGGPTPFALGRPGLDFPAVIAQRSAPASSDAAAASEEAPEGDRLETLTRRVEELTEEVLRLKSLLERDPQDRDARDRHLRDRVRDRSLREAHPLHRDSLEREPDRDSSPRGASSRAARRASTLSARAHAAMAEDDGEQCDCGMHE